MKHFTSKKGIFLIEDATYSFLGKNNVHKKFGILGDFSILNFSEGKIIPVGGGAIIINKKLKNIFRDINLFIDESKMHDDLTDFIKVLVYKIGGSKIGFSLYTYLRKIFNIDFKRSFVEPTRIKNEILNNIKIKKLSRFKLAILSTIIKSFEEDLYNRYSNTFI